MTFHAQRFVTSFLSLGLSRLPRRPELRPSWLALKKAANLENSSTAIQKKAVFRMVQRDLPRQETDVEQT